jgi:hypothetical protein
MQLVLWGFSLAEQRGSTLKPTTHPDLVLNQAKNEQIRPQSAYACMALQKYFYIDITQHKTILKHINWL